ncbi:carbohydrate ABC transporter permease [Vibrio gangliei]|uniref:carbohydrate ABC transporter permease n=1 Tax=Vibrio gangliei TaxID=2077090 RepID=UPI000D01BBE3|nr:sugar ABC transporter permease [Vibrio gangliei]
MTQATQSVVSAHCNKKASRFSWSKLTPYGFLMPFIVLFSMFGLFPLLFSVFLSFHAWNPVEGLDAMQYVGLENYDIALTDPWLWRSLKNTVWLAITSGVMQHLVAIPVAYILVSFSDRLRHWLTSAYFLPYITSTVAVSLIFFNMYSPTSGVINQTLVSLANSPILGWAFSWVLEFQPIRWLEDSTLIKPSIAFVVFWKYTGFNIVLYTTGLMTIPKDILEAARMDGANAIRRFWHISLPMIRPFIFFAVTLTIIGNLQLFEEPFVLTRGTGGTGQSGLTISMYLYKVGWEWLEMGTASAISWLLFALIATMTALQFFFFGKKGLEAN